MPSFEGSGSPCGRGMPSPFIYSVFEFVVDSALEDI